MIATALAGCWRRDPPPLNISADEFDRIALPLLGSGAAALAWRKLRASALRDTTAASGFRDAHRYFVVEMAAQEQQIASVFTLLRSAGIEPIIVKGWAVARLYPERGLRPATDIDLVVRPEQFAAAAAMLETLTCAPYWVDLHRGLNHRDDRALDELYARSQLVRLGDVDVRVLAPEDHLRVLAVHFLAHGGWRPLWLCDIAVALEARARDLDWDLCLGKGQRADWVACALGIAQQLLGAQVDDTPAATRARNLPRWLIPAVLEAWERPSPDEQRTTEPFINSLRHPLRLPRALRERWPNPILATVLTHSPFNNVPRLFCQLEHYFLRSAAFAASRLGLLREQGAR